MLSFEDSFLDFILLEIVSIDIVVSPEIDLSEMYILFKTAKRKSVFHKYKHGYVNSPYEQYAELVQVEQSLKPDYKELLDF